MFSTDDMHMFALTLNGFLQSINPLLLVLAGAWIRHMSGKYASPDNAPQTKPPAA